MHLHDASASVPTLVVVDTTAIRSDLFLQGGNWRILLDRTKRGDVRLFVPEVVVQESARHARRSGRPDLRKSAEEGIKALKVLGFPDVPGTAEVGPLVDKIIQEYPATLRARIEENGGKVLPLPKVGHDSLLERAMSGRKPFKDQGDGYRDALIWESMLDLCRKESTPGLLVLVTGNHSDFCDSDGDTLASQLTEELPEEWRSQRIKSVRELIETFWPRTKSSDAEAEQQPSTDEPAQGSGKEPDHAPSGEVISGDAESEASLIARIRSVVETAVDEIANAEVRNPYVDEDGRGPGLEFDLSLPWGDLQSVTVESFWPDEDAPEINLIDTLSTGQRVFDVRRTGVVEFEGFMFLSDAMAHSEDGTVSVIDWQWNDSVSRVSISRQCSLEYLAFDDSEGGDIAVEFQQASPIPFPDR